MYSFGDMNGNPLVVGELYVIRGSLYFYTGLVESHSVLNPNQMAPQFGSCFNENVTLTEKFRSPLRIRPATDKDIIQMLDVDLSFELGKVTDKLTVLVEPLGIHILDNENESVYLDKEEAKALIKFLQDRIAL